MGNLVPKVFLLPLPGTPGGGGGGGKMGDGGGMKGVGGW